MELPPVVCDDLRSLGPGDVSVLRFAEEIMLLLLDDKGGRFADVPALSLEYALAGAVLMDLTLEFRIDTDPERLFVIDPAPLEDDLLDPTLPYRAIDGDARRPLLDRAQRFRVLVKSANAPSPVSSSAAFCAGRTTVSCGCSRRDAIRSSSTGPFAR